MYLGCIFKIDLTTLLNFNENMHLYIINDQACSNSGKEKLPKTTRDSNLERNQTKNGNPSLSGWHWIVRLQQAHFYNCVIWSKIRNSSFVLLRIQYHFNAKYIHLDLIHCWRFECKIVHGDLSPILLQQRLSFQYQSNSITVSRWMLK